MLSDTLVPFTAVVGRGPCADYDTLWARGSPCSQSQQYVAFRIVSHSRAALTPLQLPFLSWGNDWVIRGNASASGEMGTGPNAETSVGPAGNGEANESVAYSCHLELSREIYHLCAQESTESICGGDRGRWQPLEAHRGGITISVNSEWLAKSVQAAGHAASLVCSLSFFCFHGCWTGMGTGEGQEANRRVASRTLLWLLWHLNVTMEWLVWHSYTKARKRYSGTMPAAILYHTLKKETISGIDTQLIHLYCTNQIVGTEEEQADY